MNCTCQRTALAAMILTFGANDAGAEDAEPATLPAVLELYTSQGCSSCPAADAMLGEMVKEHKVIGLTFSVDYWDYLGWKDTMGSPIHSERQRGYARVRGGGQVYTPQLVINGMTQVVGSNRDAVKKAIRESNKDVSAERVDIALRTDGDAVVIEAGVVPASKGGSHSLLAKAGRKAATIWLALVRKQISVKVKTGENRGRVLEYVNAVRDISAVGMWTGTPIVLRLPKRALMRRDADAAVALLQVEGQGPILGAAEIPLR